MSNLYLNIKRFLTAFCKPLIRFLKQLQRRQNPYDQLVKTREILRRQLADPQNKDKALQTYNKVLSLARECNYRELAQVVIEFDPLLSEHNFKAGFVVGQTLSFLLEANPQTAQNLDAAWRLSCRLTELTSRREVQQQICLQAARMGDSNLLLVKLLNRCSDGTLTRTELSQILNHFLENHVFQL